MKPDDTSTTDIADYEIPKHSLSLFDSVYQSYYLNDRTTTVLPCRPLSATTDMSPVEMFQATFIRSARQAEIKQIIQRERQALTPDVEYQEEE